MTTSQLILFVLFPLVAYLLGSIPFALVIGKANGVDIRTTGSKNIGATNLGRTLGLRFFWYAFFCDAGKGLLPTLAASLTVRHLQDSSVPHWTPLLTAIAALLGHVFPIYLKFKGGKGVATAFGVTLGIWPLYTLAGLGAGLVFIIVFLGWRYISLASITASVAFVAFVAYLGTSSAVPGVSTYLPWPDLYPLLAVAVAFALMIIIKHRGNIGRLLAGTEPRFGQKKAGGVPR